MTFSLKWGISEKKTRDICLNVGFSEIKQLILDEMGIFEEKTHDFCLNGRFLKRKRVIFAKMGDFREENT